MKITITYKKHANILDIPESFTVQQLKEEIVDYLLQHQNLYIDADNVKLVFKGILKNDKTLEESKIVEGTKIMMIASEKTEIEKVKLQKAVHESVFEEVIEKEDWNTITKHQSVIKMGIPANSEVSKNGNCRLPLDGNIKNLRNNLGEIMRMKIENARVYLSTNSGQMDFPFMTVSDIEAQEIKSFPGYSIIRLGLRPVGCLFIYFVPNHYVGTIKENLLGTF